MADLQNSLRAISLMDILGTNPEAMVDKLRKRAIAEFRGTDEGNKKVSRLKREKISDFKFESMLAEITGDINVGTHTNLARFTHAYTSVQSLAKLGAPGS